MSIIDKYHNTNKFKSEKTKTNNIQNKMAEHRKETLEINSNVIKSMIVDYGERNNMVVEYEPNNPEINKRLLYADGHIALTAVLEQLCLTVISESNEKVVDEKNLKQTIDVKLDTLKSIISNPCSPLHDFYSGCIYKYSDVDYVDMNYFKRSRKDNLKVINEENNNASKLGETSTLQETDNGEQTMTKKTKRTALLKNKTQNFIVEYAKCVNDKLKFDNEAMNLIFFLMKYTVSRFCRYFYRTLALMKNKKLKSTLVYTAVDVLVTNEVFKKLTYRRIEEKLRMKVKTKKEEGEGEGEGEGGTGYSKDRHGEMDGVR